MSETRLNLPALGTAIRHEWPLDWRFLTVNHGSFGATPLVVTAAQDAWRRRLEEQPSYFMRRVLPDALRHAATRARTLPSSRTPRSAAMPCCARCAFSPATRS
jgi:hypothetical protein